MPEGRRNFIARVWGEAKAATFDVDPGPLGWLVGLLDDAGTVRHEFGGMGLVTVGLAWADLVAWLDGAQEHSLSPTFRRAMLLLSAHAADVTNAARELECEAPYDPGKG